MTNPIKKVLGLAGCHVEVTLESDGEKVSNSYQPLSVSVNYELNRIPTARLVFADGDAAKRDFELSSLDVFKPGKELKVLAGSGKEKVVIFVGLIVKHAIKVRGASGSALVIDCKDRTAKLTVTRENHFYEQKTDSDIIDDILDRNDLEGDLETTEVQHEQMVQYYCTDWDFIVTRAEANGCVVIVDQGILTIKKPKLEDTTDQVITFGDNVYDFDAQLDATTQYENVIAQSWTIKDEEFFEEDATVSGLQRQGNIKAAALKDVFKVGNFELRHDGMLQTQELRTWAKAKTIKSRLSRIIGSAKIEGNAKIKPGTTVLLQGFGTRFNGYAYVTAVRHTLQAGNWFSYVQFGAPEAWFNSNGKSIQATSAGGLLPGIGGIHRGIVKNIYRDDPKETEERIQVQIPIIDPNSEGIWARVAQPDAGNNRGFLFRPEIGDEVVIGFFNDDPRHPVILGMLHSSTHKAPVPASEGNAEKGIFTKSKMKILFNDEKQNLTLATESGNQVLISEEEKGIVLTDQHGNLIKMNQDGIVIKSIKDIKLQADQGNIDSNGKNITHKASMEFKADGSIGAALTTDGNAVIKGTLVQIN